MLKQTREICRKYNFRPLRRGGQNFLINDGILEKSSIFFERGLVKQKSICHFDFTN